MSDETKLLGESKGLIDTKYQDWCLKNPVKLPSGDIIINSLEEIKELQVNFIKDFHQTDPNIFDDIINADNENEKNDDTSFLFREQGNKFYQDKQLKAAIDCYNKAISHAKEDSTLALAYANRSAVLFQMNDFKACLRDIARALEKKYPDNLSHKLLDRKGKCFMKLKNYSEAILVFGQAMNKAKENIADEKKSAMFISDCQKFLKFCSGKKAQSVPLSDNDQGVDKLPMLTGVNPQMPALSKSAKISYSPKVGRHAVATRKIGCGEVILVENSGISFLDLEHRGDFCSHCFGFVHDLIPSPDSARDMFCSETCKKNAMNSYHALESKMFTALEKGQIAQKEWLLPLRTVLTKPLKYFLENRKELMADFPKDYAVDMKENEVYKSWELSSLFSLQRNETGWSAQYLHLTAFVAYFYLKCLQKVGYLKKSDELNRDDIFIAEMLMKLMNISSTNACEVGTFDAFGKESIFEGDFKCLGGSIEPTLVLLNHSCDPNTIRVNFKDCSVLLANRTIKEGEEIAHPYSNCFAEAEISVRQSYLKRKYCFDCQCQPCLEKWPTNDKMPKSFDDLQDGQLLVDMDNTKLFMQQVTKIQKLGSSISQEQKAGNFKKAFGFCVEFVKVLEETIKRPHCYYIMAEKSLFKLSWILHGSKYQ